MKLLLITQSQKQKTNRQKDRQRDISVVCIHFTINYFFDLLSLQRQDPLSWSESELTIPGTKVPGNIRSQERKFPESSPELSFLGAKVPNGNFRSEERKTGERKVLIPNYRCHILRTNLPSVHMPLPPIYPIRVNSSHYWNRVYWICRTEINVTAEIVRLIWLK